MWISILTYQNRAHHSHLPPSHIIVASIGFTYCISIEQDWQQPACCWAATHWFRQWIQFKLHQDGEWFAPLVVTGAKSDYGSRDLPSGSESTLVAILGEHSLLLELGPKPRLEQPSNWCHSYYWFGSQGRCRFRQMAEIQQWRSFQLRHCCQWSGHLLSQELLDPCLWQLVGQCLQLFPERDEDALPTLASWWLFDSEQ